jgi:hypothetical protein
MRRIPDDGLIEIANLNLDFPLAFPTGPRLPTWQSPQIQIAGPSGSAPPSTLSSTRSSESYSRARKRSRIGHLALANFFQETRHRRYDIVLVEFVNTTHPNTAPNRCARPETPDPTLRPIVVGADAAGYEDRGAAER